MRMGEKIKQLGGERGFSQKLLEQKSGVSAKLLSKYENGTCGNKSRQMGVL